MPSKSMLPVLAALMITPVACLMCNVGSSHAYEGHCPERSDRNTISSVSCSEGESYCTTYSYKTSARGCNSSNLIALCSSTATACSTYDSVVGSNDDYQCETCGTDNCNPTQLGAPRSPRRCNVGFRQTYSGHCIYGEEENNTMSSATCAEGEYCTTYSHSRGYGFCRTTFLYGLCTSRNTACSTYNSRYSSHDDYQCNTCGTDNCNPTDAQHFSRTCNVGTRTTYIGECGGLSEESTVSSLTCSEGEYCTTYSYNSTTSGCTTRSLIASCTSNASACLGAVWGGSDGYQCETCDTDDCNPTEAPFPELHRHQRCAVGRRTTYVDVNGDYCGGPGQIDSDTLSPFTCNDEEYCSQFGTSRKLGDSECFENTLDYACRAYVNSAEQKTAPASIAVIVLVLAALRLGE
mmetsp:Transcript_25333/g.58876  ORF Transcript_25333/g.58876 Transcript_25333/m.58876 type:complete len:406 (+) Transcript_25333:140-1357(+)|eukprot:CAMPEP_0178389632 /NCGR_PEP_ID=MMETSP0689_2-20121128/10224_1 /TAXON_ID=160604 /ORGANISM="Amphidinium massartii, Strain CS-259" /LENGTH=405 /DNA_ID=CAMNT_0020010103 /DNA_START=58 /DNA_END=1275 /DNA_ORIENTATION=+